VAAWHTGWETCTCLRAWGWGAGYGVDGIKFGEVVGREQFWTGFREELRRFEDIVPRCGGWHSTDYSGGPS